MPLCSHIGHRLCLHRTCRLRLGLLLTVNETLFLDQPSLEGVCRRPAGSRDRTCEFSVGDICLDPGPQLCSQFMWPSLLPPALPPTSNQDVCDVYPAAPSLLREASLQTKVRAVPAPSPQALLILPFTLRYSRPSGQSELHPLS